MTLGDLEFKAEDFAELETYRQGRPSIETATAVLARFCNTILRERLQKALELFWHESSNPDETGPYAVSRERGSRDTHRARLVCIEEIKP